MSFTVLRDIETCPLRWSLRRASYVGLWSRDGYPGIRRLGTLTGQVVHRALERIVGEVARQAEIGHAAPNSLEVLVRALRALDGITAVLELTIADVTRSWEGNPRFGSRARELKEEVRRQVPALRQRVQQMLAHVDVSREGFDGRLGVVPSEPSGVASPCDHGPAPLDSGLHAEVALNNAALDWSGKADLLRVAKNACTIIDFKTGAPKEDHVLQLRIYALLWQRDHRLNPRARPATALTIMYPNGPVTVDVPGAAEFDALASELVVRADAARAAVGGTPPEARPSRMACEWCDVRHLCDTYWQPADQSTLPDKPQGRGAGSDDAPEPVEMLSSASAPVDVELRILAAQGEWSWLASLSAIGMLTAGIEAGARVLVRARPRDSFFSALMRVGTHVRVVGAQVIAPTDESAGLPILALGRSTEVFVLPQATARSL